MNSGGGFDTNQRGKTMTDKIDKILIFPKTGETQSIIADPDDRQNQTNQILSFLNRNNPQSRWNQETHHMYDGRVMTVLREAGW